MKLLHAFLAGIRKAVHAWPVAVITFFVQLVMAGIAALLFKSALSNAFGSSLAPDQFLQGFNFAYVIDLLKKNPGLLPTVFAVVTWMMVINNFLFLFFKGGIIASVGPDNENVTLPAFFGGCGQYLGRFFRLFLITAMAALVLAFILGMAAGFLFPLVQGDGETEMQSLQAAGAVAVLFMLFFSILFLIADYAQVLTVAGDERKMFLAFWTGVKFMFRRFLSAYGLFLLFTIGNILIVGVSVFAGGHMNAESGLALLGIFLLQQIFMLIGAWWRVAAVGGQVELYYSIINKAPASDIVQEPPAPAVVVPVMNVVLPPEEQLIIKESAPAVKRTRRSVPRKRVVPAARKKVVKRTPKKLRKKQTGKP
jgi:hypothetical protein